MVEFNVVWGIKGVDRSGSDPWDAEDYGRPVYDPTFDPSSPEAQQWLSDTCQGIKDEGLTYSPTSLSCFTDDLKLFLPAEYNTTFPYVASSDPATQKAAFADMATHSRDMLMSEANT